ncbi:hypothetical protein I6F21_06735 [Bradyrhizobium sp. NBAIM03]|uniref:hypothetical protein n=1 Tax=Bradyrhizobium sp. NBAIM03 TaxID=2793816 RepID=UPI001CD2BEA2|nr:hypothetical protein [Bradyrhizobium sp. NBAIM03]MCA1532257.1 hypothetical protein [Bradyrhizobium sp. NBAIM03]
MRACPVALLAAILWSARGRAGTRNQFEPSCTADTTPADKMINACEGIIAWGGAGARPAERHELNRGKARRGKVISTPKNKHVPMVELLSVGVYLAEK